ncbi:protein FAM83D [Acanthopagrus latus]|uniref:protein FAM83D n=1 Tax=Acanthopagrus latus TaxID=8177 RepID=UPI00187C56BC|nr:protein FAM83D [Acanthopagrus latus]
MSNYQEQSLDVNAEFHPLTESSPGFLHCESERQAVERLIIEGPEAFYSFVDSTKSLGCFLSPAEISQINSWAEDFRFTQLEVQKQENGIFGSLETEDFCSTYFPSCSDTPAPELELGWPAKNFWPPKESIAVYTSPPAENKPPVREIIRQHLQRATKVIAIVTDQLTDSAIISDLHRAASRGVPVYIILNQRSIQENFTLNRLRHPLMRVRVLGGKTFCTRMGRMVVGEMKDQFLLVDLDTVIHGSYSLTWSDAHLHRQLITVLTGLVVESFDTEFRIIYAVSLPVPNTCTVPTSLEAVTYKPKERPTLRFQNQKLPLQPAIDSPPPPPVDMVLDWKAMGVFSDQCAPDSPQDQQEAIVAKAIPLKNNMASDKNAPIMDCLTDTGNQNVDKNRVEGILEKIISRHPSKERNFKLNGKTPTALEDTATEQTNVELKIAPTQRQVRLNREPIKEEEYRASETSSKVENKPSSRKPLILRVPQSESFSSLNDIMKRLTLRQNPSEQLNRESMATASSELSRSMMDLSVDNTDTKDAPPPRFKATGFDPDQMTASLSLMKRRNDEFKPLLYRTPKNILPRERPRSSSYALSMDWRKSLAELEEQKESGALK